MRLVVPVLIALSAAASAQTPAYVDRSLGPLRLQRLEHGEFADDRHRLYLYAGGD